MRIYKYDQYNQGIGRSKLFSSVAGVGSIVITKFGNSSLVLCIEEWGVIKKVNEVIELVENDITVNKEQHYSHLKNRLAEHKINLINDLRFLEFIQREQELPNLLALVDVPHLSLDEGWNKIQSEKKGKKNDSSDPLLEYYIPSIHFPSYFVGRKSKELRELKWWKKKWGNGVSEFFAPPKDFSTSEEDKKSFSKLNSYKLLIQNNLVFICRNGHLSNIPWSKYLNWKSQKFSSAENRSEGYDDKARVLFQMDDCCANPKLFLTESRNTSEGYSNIFLECKNSNCKKKVNLEGINSIRPKCPGHKPWTMTSELNNDFLPRDNYCECSETRISLISASSIYYSRTFTNIFLPIELIKGYSEEVNDCLNRQEEKFKLHIKKIKEVSREKYAEKINLENLYFNYENQIENDPQFIDKVKEAFLTQSFSKTIELDKNKIYENYRFQEYKAFISNVEYLKNKKLSFTQISIPEKLQSFFDVISRIDVLAESQIQLGFSRITPLDSDDRENQMTIYRSMKKDVRVLPSIQSLGEGIFFSLNSSMLEKWMNDNPNLENRLKNILIQDKEMSSSTKLKLEKDGVRFLLIHSLCHLIMRGLEFSCGYPTSSLKERLYVSDRMNGFMIYTSEGSEGSMGGLVSQTESENLITLFDKSFREAYDCSSDPLCWESTSQGVSGLNLAACFSCSLTSETSCEEFNLGLDRRVVIDPEFGFFRDYEF